MEMAYLCSSQFHQLAAREFTLCCLTCMASKWFWLADEISARQWASDFRSSSPGWLGFYLGFLTIWWAIPRVTTMREQGGIFPYLTLEVFSNESTICIRWTKYWSFSFSIIPSKEIPKLISFRMDWLDLLAVQGTLKSLLQHHSSKASILQHSAFFSPTLTSIHDHWKNHSLD